VVSNKNTFILLECRESRLNREIVSYSGVENTGEEQNSAKIILLDTEIFVA